MIKLLLAPIFFCLRFQESDSANFTVKPPDVTVGEDGGEIILNWVYESEKPFIFMKWLRSETATSIMTLRKDENQNNVVDAFGAYKTPKVRAFYEKLGTATIKITDLVQADEGKIQVSIDFDGGALLSHETDLVVGYKPADTTLTQPGPVQENKNLILICESTAKPAPSITWLQKGVKIRPSSRIFITSVTEAIGTKFKTKSQLEFKNLLKTDAGLIVCEATNDLAKETANLNLNVLYAPFNTRLSFQFNPGKQGGENKLFCTADANPGAVTYEIHHNDKKIFEGDVGTYVFNPLRNYHAGTYKCLPKNFVGTGVIASRELKVDVAPEIYSSTPDTLIANENDNIEIVCNILSYPISTVGWSKKSGGNSGVLNINTTTISENSSLVLLTTAVKLSRLKRTDYGTYICDASNKFGQASKEIKLIVHYKPEITLHSLTNQNLFLNKSESTTESCSAIGLPKPDLSWYRDNVEIQNGGKHSIENSVLSDNRVQSIISLNDVNSDDSGILRCLAKNTVGEDQRSTNLNIYNRAEINTELSDITYVNLGTGHSLSCVATGVETPKIYWFKNDALIVSGSGNFIIAWNTIDSFSVSSILKINPVTAEDSNAVYKCLANNSRGMDSRQTLISVYFGPRITSFPPTHIVTQEDRVNYEISCLLEANPRPTVTWYKDENLINPQNSNEFVLDEQVIVQNNIVSRIRNTLIFKLVNRVYFGNWTCVGKNTIARGVQSETQMTTFLTVTYPPKFEYISPNPSRVDQSDTVIFICRVKASPKPYVWWELPPGVERDSRFTRQTSTIRDSSQFGSVEDKLSIRNIQRKDVGDYVCHTNNTIVSAQKESRLIVQYAPIFITTPVHTVYLQRNIAHTIIFKTLSSPPINTFSLRKSNGGFILYKINTTMESNTTYRAIQTFGISFNENNVTLSMAGVYTFSAGNTIKTSYYNFTLLILASPNIQLSTTHAHINITANSTIHLSCYVNAFPLSDVFWMNEKTILPSKTSLIQRRYFVTLISTLSLYTLYSLTKNQTALYKCSARNFIGMSSASVYLNIQYPPVVTANFQEESYTVSEKQINFIEVLVDSNPISIVEWFISKGNGTIYTKLSSTLIQSIQVAAVKEYEVKFKSRLLFPNGISRTDNAWFKAVVTNSLGKQEKKTYITIEWKPEAQTKLEPKQDTMLGESPVFLCRFLSNPESTIEWFKNGEPFTKIGYRTTTLRYNSSMTLSQSVLTFLNVERRDMGNYSCKATNSIGSSLQWKVLNVLHAPIVHQAKVDILVDPGETLILDCNADANPPVTIFDWTKNGIPIPINSRRFSQSNMNANNAGLFICRPGNNLGNSETITFNVTVRIPPTFTEPAVCRKVLTSAQTERLHCTCAGTGYPNPKVYWTKYPNTQPLSTNNQLNFSVIPSSDGTYYCHLQNSKGDIRTSVRIANFVDFVSGWGIWEACNSTCGPGIQERNRICNVAPCPEVLQEVKACSVECKDAQQSEDVNWLYALYALIPCAILFFVLIGLWVVRLNRVLVRVHDIFENTLTKKENETNGVVEVPKKKKRNDK